jgi:hypothetical protein
MHPSETFPLFPLRYAKKEGENFLPSPSKFSEDNSIPSVLLADLYKQLASPL